MNVNMNNNDNTIGTNNYHSPTKETSSYGIHGVLSASDVCEYQTIPAFITAAQYPPPPPHLSPTPIETGSVAAPGIIVEAPPQKPSPQQTGQMINGNNGDFCNVSGL